MMILLCPLLVSSLYVPAVFCYVEQRPTQIERIAASISVHEGWNNLHSLVRRQHNPGALVFARQPGARRGKNAYAWFETDAHGKAALMADLRAKFSRGMTLGQIMARWSEKSYGKQVARETGVREDEVVPVNLAAGFDLQAHAGL